MLVCFGRGAVYPGIDADGALTAEWFGDDRLTLDVDFTPARWTLLSSRLCGD